MLRAYNNGLRFLFLLLTQCASILFPVLLAAQEPQPPLTYPALTKREGKDLHLPVPPPIHPRLFLTSGDLPILHNKMTSPLLGDCWNRIAAAAKLETTGYIQSGFPTDQARNAIEAKALLFVLNADTVRGNQAVAAVHNYLATFRIDSSKADVTRDVGRAILTGSLVYDWCYPLLPAEDRQWLINKMESLAARMEIKWPMLSQGSVTGHGTEAQISRDLLALGVAAYDEKPVIYNRAAGRILAEFGPVREFFYPASYHHQGSAYGPYRFSWDMVATFLFDKLGSPFIFGADQAKVPYYFIYSRRPDGQLFRNGDHFNELFIPFGKYWNFGSTSNSYAGSYYKDPILLREAIREGSLGKDADYLFDFLFCDGSIDGNADKTSLPYTRYFPSPFGAMIARTGWEEGLVSPVVMAEMKVGVYNFVNHQHLDAGSFQLYYKGPLTMESGIYQGRTGGYGSEHFLNYSQRTIAHNCLLIYDPKEQFDWQGKPVVNDGGQPYPNHGTETANLDELIQKGYKTGEVLAHAYGPDTLRPEYSYLEGDLAEAYPGKVKTCRRSFVFLNLNNSKIPAALIVFDNVVALQAGFKKYWLLHSAEEPLVTGGQTVITRSEKGYNGKMINTTLLPEKQDLNIEKIGGKDNAYSVFGKNFPQALNNPNASSSDSAVWRVQISAKQVSAGNFFLNVMQVMDNQTAPLQQTDQPQKLETDQLVGVILSDRIVLFSKKEGNINGDIALCIPGSRNYKVLITGVQPGTWKIRTAANNSAGADIINTDKVLYLHLNPGNYVLSKN